MARTNDLFGPTFVDRRTDAIKDHADSSSPSRPLTDRERAVPGALFNADSEPCVRLLGSPGPSFVSALLTSPLPWAPKLARAFEGDVETMRRVVEVLCDR
jgi:hypothetical protein